MNSSVRIMRNVALRDRNTFGVAASAPLLAEVDDASALPDLLADARFRDGALVLGGGSNLLFVQDPDRPLIVLTRRDVTAVSSRSDGSDIAVLRADAGVSWHELVMRSLELGLAGLENLALIPGTVGAAPIQNIGAYGVEVCEFIHAVEALECATGTLHRLDRAACAFGYRDSVFKREPDRFVVTAVEFALPRVPALVLEYAGIAEELAASGISAPTPRNVADAVIAIRSRKLPDPAVIGNAGSFFKNPIVPAAVADELAARHPSLPVFRAGDDAQARKLSAAWLIDNCRWKGVRFGDAGVSATHALVLVNHGDASGTQLLELARRIAASVRERHGVVLEPEPRLVGATW
ncbi:MAG: UDP-N-acetylmuramate dehydrogenase [Pseudomonadota bacterium]|nr:UDP-N-acetylmuramate dehydrogenase [Pseudomonadota bacterium]